MDAFVDLSWRPLPSAALIVIGLATVWAGTSLAGHGLRQRAGGGSNMQDFVRGFRFAVIGLVLAGLGAAWWWHVTWLFVLSLVFGGEEILESTVHLAILRWRPSPLGMPGVHPPSARHNIPGLPPKVAGGDL